MPGFGPLGPRAATVRPAKDDDGYLQQTWFKNCSAPNAADGTVPTASWFNHIIGNLVYAAAQAGVDLENDQADDTFVWLIIQAAINAAIAELNIDDGELVVNEFKNLPIYPEITSGANALSVTNNGDGTITVASSQTILWRGWKAFATSDMSLGLRTVSHVQSKTYHLRWYAPGHANAPAVDYPSGRFMLRDLADTAVYNPGSLAESSSAFDSTYDDLLVALVVTNGANVPTITSLTNKHDMTGTVAAAARNSSLVVGGAAADSTFEFTIAWGRTPKLELIEVRTPGNSRDSDYDIRPTTVTRQDIVITTSSWHSDAANTYPNQSPGFNYRLTA